jgi:hypothetical protein
VLVTGNGAYVVEGFQLVRAGACAEAVEARLAKLGVHAMIVQDRALPELQSAFDRFVAKLSPGSTAVVYFVGHGWQESHGADCFLLPCGFRGGVPQGVCQPTLAVYRCPIVIPGFL